MPFGFGERVAFPVEASKLCTEILPESLVCIAIRPVVNREIAVRFSGVSEKFSSDVAWSLSEKFGPQTVSPIRGFKLFDSHWVGFEVPDIAKHLLEVFHVCCLLCGRCCQAPRSLLNPKLPGFIQSLVLLVEPTHPTTSFPIPRYSLPCQAFQRAYPV